ncbi:spinster family MFS transporter [Denitratisoma sp. DHT3]|uniref:spinster family MFS transporter n=1 Tax=Denitratisoma sp. DHT3 TaxID=1981880 RepID=UPI001646CCB1|nr:MFS transporter [Denitratisoma sp. DHT3]
MPLLPENKDCSMPKKPLSERSWYPNYVLAVLLLAYIFSFIDRQILSLMVVPIRRDLAITDFQMSLLQGTAFALLYSVMALPIARLADAYSRRTIISSGIALWSLMTAGCGLARSYGALFLMRVGVGVGEAALSPAAYSLLSDYFSKQRLARAVAIYSLGISLGSGLAYLAGGLLMEAVSKISVIELPLLGAMKSWQVVFIVVGLPGLLIALLMAYISEPARRGALHDASGQRQKLKMRETLSFLLARWRLYLVFPIATGFLGIFSFGLMAWYPTFLIRTFGMSIGESGIYFGLTYLIVGTLGTYSGARFAEKLQHKYPDIHIRFVMISALVMVVPSVLGPLMPSAPLALAMLIPTIFLKCSYYGSTGSAMQLVTPNQMRAQVSALQIFFGNIIGLAVGASSIAALNDFVFHDDNAIHFSLALVAGTSCVGGALLLASCLKPYRRALLEARTVEETAHASDDDARTRTNSACDNAMAKS